MMNRKEWVTRHDPLLTCVDATSPLTVGNGDFAFTADISGLQTLYTPYADETPLCTMANWGWHSIPAPTPTGEYTLDDVVMDRYDFCGREVRYAKSCFPGNEQVYHWLRENPHKLNLARVGLRLNGKELAVGDFAQIQQRLHLYKGQLESCYQLRGVDCRVVTACAPECDALALRIESALLADGLTVDLDMPYGAPDITAADWQSPQRHTTVLEGNVIHRQLDALHYDIRIDAPGARVEQIAPHRVRISTGAPVLEVALSFGQATEATTCNDILRSCEDWWARFWDKGGIIDLAAASDPRAMELERRIVLSLYLLAINSSGSMPPAETGLICNSWYGKAHLEMHFWHMAWAPLWGHSDLLERSLPWYHAHLPQARENAARNGYRGARWPKMIADTAVDSPSPIAVLLVWQQPHIIVMLELIRRALLEENPARAATLLEEQWPLISETADFMADYVVPDADGVYHIMPPVIPAQERYEPEETRDPAFEVAYWKFALSLAIHWAETMGRTPDAKWVDVHQHMAPPPVHEGLYIGHADCPETFTTKTDDHPSMLQCLGMLPTQDVDHEIMARTLHTVIDRWDYPELWGWDFAVMAMTALRLGETKTALDQLMSNTVKNTYVVSGNNRQASRKDLPLYLPGNGSLLLAAALLAAGCDEPAPFPGFRAEEGWQVTHEGLHRYF